MPDITTCPARAHTNRPFHNELVIDAFCGGGGASQGIKKVIGREVDIAIDNDPLAIEMHAANNKSTRHVCADVRAIDWKKLTRGRSTGIAWFSPSCSQFSIARGNRPTDPVEMMLPMTVIDCAKEICPRIVIVENVPKLAEWDQFAAWCQSLIRIGYKLDWRIINAAHFGAATIRRRLVVIARRDEPTRWPRPSPVSARASDYIDFTKPIPSIFASPKHANGERRPMTNRNLITVLDGALRHAILPITHFGCVLSTAQSFELDRCFRTILPYLSIYALVRVDLRRKEIRMRRFTPRELAGMQGWDSTYKLTGTRENQVNKIGASVCPPVAEALVRANSF